jgi:hypothetical protein
MPSWRIRAGFLVGLIALGLLAIAVHPSHVVPAKHPSWLDEIFDDAALLTFVRLGVILGASYVGISIVALVTERRWLTELGPVKAAKPLEHGFSAGGIAAVDLEDAEDTIGRLEGLLRTATGELDKARSDIDFLVRQTAILDAGGKEKDLWTV